MLSLYCYLIRERRYRLWYPVSLVFFLLALMSKEVAATLPVAVFLLAWGERSRGERAGLKTAAAETGGFLAVLGFYLIVRQVVIVRLGPVPPVMMSDNPMVGMGFLERLPTALAVLWRYFLLLLWPVRLSADYSYNQVPVAGSLFNLRTLAGLAAAAAVIAGFVRSAKRSRTAFTGLVLLAPPFLVFSNILFTTGTIMGERLLYTPSLGWCLLAAWAAFFIIGERLNRPSLARWALIVVTVLFAGRTFARNFDWKDNDTIFEKTAETAPNSVKTSYNYALVLKRRGELDRAINWYQRAVDIWPGHQNAWFNLANALRERGKLREAVGAYRKAIELLPDDTGAMHNLALTYRELNEPENAVATFRRILLTRPNDLSVYTNIAITWASAGEYERALEIFEQIAEANPEDGGAMANIANTWVALGDSTKAETYYRRAMELSPRNPAPFNAMLALHLNRGRFEDARLLAAEMRNRNIPIMRTLADKLAE